MPSWLGDRASRGWGRSEEVSALVAADPPIDAGVAAEQVGLVAQAALIAAPTTTSSVFIGAAQRVGEANTTVLVPIIRTGDLTRAGNH